jgi:hypothetical protein
VLAIGGRLRREMRRAVNKPGEAALGAGSGVRGSHMGSRALFGGRHRGGSPFCLLEIQPGQQATWSFRPRWAGRPQTGRGKAHRGTWGGGFPGAFPPCLGFRRAFVTNINGTTYRGVAKGSAAKHRSGVFQNSIGIPKGPLYCADSAALSVCARDRSKQNGSTNRRYKITWWVE